MAKIDLPQVGFEPVTARPWRRRLLSSAVLAGLLAILGGCADSDDRGAAAGTRAVAHRFLPAPATILPDTRSLLRATPIRTWTFADSEGWEVRPRALAPRGGFAGGLCPGTERAVVSIDLAAESALDAEQAHEIEVEIAGGGVADTELCWAGTGEDFAAERCLQAHNVGDQPRRFRFALGSIASWSGRIVQLRLAPLTDRCFTLRELTASRLELDDAAVTMSRGTGVAAAFGAGRFTDTRPALVAVPGRPIVQQLEVPLGGALHVGLGVEFGVRDPVVFEVSARKGAADLPRPLFERTIEPPATADAARWVDVVVDLRPFAGETVELVLETKSPGKLAPGLGFAVWGAPQVVAGHAGPERPNVLLVSLDTLRRDHLSLYGYQRDTTPNLERWAERCGVVFEKAVAPSPWTLPSHVAMFTGLDALSHRVNHAVPVPARLTMLAQHLRSAGYDTAAVTGGAYLAPAFGLSRGFDRFWHWSSRDIASASDEIQEGIGRTRALLDGGLARPFFLFLHTYEVHTPYEEREPYFSRFRGDSGEKKAAATSRVVVERQQPPRADDGYQAWFSWNWLDKFHPANQEGVPLRPDERQLAVDLYDSGIAYTDAQLGELLDHLHSTGLDRTTWVIVTSDHGEALGEDGLMGHAYLDDSNLLVPLVVFPPACAGGGRRIPGLARTIDVTPTILDALGIEVDTPRDGESLMPALRGESWRGARTAWSYAGSTGRGAALRVDDRWRYELANSAFAPDWGQAKQISLVDGELSRVDVPDSVRRTMLERLRSGTEGLHLRFANAEAAPIEFRVTGGAIDTKTIKAWSHPPAPIRFEEWRTLVVTLPPGSSLELLVGKVVPPTRMQVAVAAPPGSEIPKGTLGLDFPVGRLSRRICLVDGAWSADHCGQPGASLRTGLEANWTHDAATALAGEPGAADPELTGRLRALGYI